MKSGHIEFMQITTTHLSDRFIPVVFRMISIVTLSLSLKTNLIYRDRVFFVAFLSSSSSERWTANLGVIWTIRVRIALFVADAARSGMRNCNRPSSRACFCRLDCTRWIIFHVSMHDSGVYISIMQIRCILELVETCRDKDPNLMAVY
jgi:hypothetical protein